MNPNTSVNDYNYQAAGFDGFLSRSIDDLPQATLDSGGPQTTALRYDSAQLSGAIGDKFMLGSIELSGKDNSMTLNDGVIFVNDTSTNSKIQASAGNIGYYDSTGNLVVQEGILPAGFTGIRLVDKNQVGLAQFAKDKDNHTALRIAKPSIEVATARNDELIFNSDQNTFKIINTGTITCPAVGPVTAAVGQYNREEDLIETPHGLTFAPIVLGFLPKVEFLDEINYLMPYSTVNNSGATGAYWINYKIASNGTNISAITELMVSGTTVTAPALTVTYYYLQETAAAS